MLLRTLALVLLVLLVVRLVMRLAVRLVTAIGHSSPAGRGSGAAGRPGAPVGERSVKRLVPCPVCGTHFEVDRGLPRRAGEPPVCSESCRTAPAAASSGAGPDPRAHPGTPPGAG
jgi:hypothetical protein